jgi:hypothetical protein
MRCIRLLVLLQAALLAVTVALAQPNPYGCHFFRNAPQVPVLTDQQRSDIASTIARSDTFDILHYDIQLDLTNYSGQLLAGTTTVTFQALMAGQQQIRFDLYALQVDSVTGPSGPLSFDHDGEFLRVDLPAPAEVGEPQEVTVHYRGTPHRDPQWGGFYFQQGYMYNLGIGISSIPPNFGKVWYPCFDSFVERATYTYHVKSAGTYRFHGQGTFLGEVTLGGDTVVRSYGFDQPIPTHLSAVAVANYQEHAYMHPGLNGDIPVTLRAKPNLLSGMVNRFGQLWAAIDACEHWYGPYPFERVGYVHTVDGALEIPTNIAYPDFMNQQSNLNNRDLYSHELGHHWWGDIVTPFVHNDMWLKEGPAEYSGHLVQEWIDGTPGLWKAVKDNLLFVLRQAHVNDDGFQALSPMPDEHIYGTHTYYKGAMVMHNLRGYLGDELFRQAMREIQIGLAYSTITPEQFKEALELYTDVDLDPFFTDWVFSPTYSVFEVLSWNATPSGPNYTVDLQVGQKLRGGEHLHTAVPVDLTFISSTGQVHDQLVYLGGQDSELQVSAPFMPAMVVLNRYARLNQARLDHEVTIPPGPNFDMTLPHVEVRAYCDAPADTVLLRIEHLWVAPDPGPLGADVLGISTTHYWNVDGLWPEGSQLRGRFSYIGLNVNQLDHALIAGNEFGMCMLYRATPNDPWEVYPHQVVSAGSLINASGSIMVTDLRRGQYAFGKTIGFVGLGEADAFDHIHVHLMPVPTADRLTVRGSLPLDGALQLDVLTLDGRQVLRSTTNAVQGVFEQQIDVSRLPAGAYLMRVMTRDGLLIGSPRFEVVR